VILFSLSEEVVQSCLAYQSCKKSSSGSVSCPPKDERLPSAKRRPSANSAVKATMPTYRAVILTALPVECNAVNVHLVDSREEVHRQGTVYHVGRFCAEDHNWEVLVLEVGAGNDDAAFEAERAISYFGPDIALFVGVAGGIKDVTVGDVVAATKIYGYESGKAESVFRSRPDVGQSSYAMVQRSRAEAKKSRWVNRIIGGATTNPQVLVGPIAAGEKVVASTESEVYKFIRETYSDALAVEMEGRGFLTATHANQVQALVVRGISDTLNNKSDLDDSARQRLASIHASAFAFDVIAQLKPLTSAHSTREKFAGSEELRSGDALNLPDSRASRSAVAAERIGEIAPQVDISVRRQLFEAAGEYERLRGSMPTGNERTTRMEEEIVEKKIRPLAISGYPLLKEFSESWSPGDGLVAVVMLQARPNPNYIRWLGARISGERAFIGYHAALALLAAVRVLNVTHHRAIREVIGASRQALGTGEGKEGRRKLLDDAEKELR
jgi:nucleoside phosphorylase